MSKSTETWKKIYQSIPDNDYDETYQYAHQPNKKDDIQKKLDAKSLVISSPMGTFFLWYGKNSQGTESASKITVFEGILEKTIASTPQKYNVRVKIETMPEGNPPKELTDLLGEAGFKKFTK